MAKPKSTQGKTTKMTDNTTVEAATVPVKRSLAERIEATRALLAKYLAEQNSLTQINNVEVGDDVTFKFGRAEKARNLDGKVIAVGDTEQGRVVAVQTGEGLDVKTIKVRAADITEKRSADERSAPSDEAPASDDTDPLSAA